VAAGETLASIVVTPHVPYALDANIADARIAVDESVLRAFTPGRRLSPVDPVRRLFETVTGEAINCARDPSSAFDFGALTTAAQLLGAGRWLLDTSVSYAKQRRQYGR
jgi:hypothetical protein